MARAVRFDPNGYRLVLPGTAIVRVGPQALPEGPAWNSHPRHEGHKEAKRISGAFLEPMQSAESAVGVLLSIISK